MKALERLRQDLEASPDGCVSLPKSAFMKAPTATQLLALMGLHNRRGTSWREQLTELLRQQKQSGRSDLPLQQLATLVSDALKALSTAP